MKKYYDISIEINNKTVVFPGDDHPLINTKKGKEWTVSKISLGSHTGTHLDAPMHVFGGKKGLSSISLDTLIGNCRVLDLTAAKNAISVDDLKKDKIKTGERILVKTPNSMMGYKSFRRGYIYLSGDAADYLAKLKIRLFGIDYLSVSGYESGDNRPHTSLLKNGVAVLETIDLSNIKPGAYHLIALPLRLGNIDGSPVRAVLYR